jgi:hypothetical protein
MKKTNLFTGFIASALLLTALPASAVSYNGHYYASHHIWPGSSFKLMQPDADNFCFLTRVQLMEIGGAECSVTSTEGIWVLQASSLKFGNVARCNARCYTNQ